jgi:type IV secretory pathway VirB10-like protein
MVEGSVLEASKGAGDHAMKPVLERSEGSAKLSKSYMIMAGVVAVIIALMVYMWLDTRRLDRSLSPKAEPAPEVSESTTAQTGDMNPPSYRESKPIERKPPPRQDRPEREEPVKEDRKPSKRKSTPATGHTDDWMFKRGKNAKDVEDEPIESEVTSTPE